jgi:predicted phosphohydrolase
MDVSEKSERRLYYVSDIHLELRKDKIKKNLIFRPIDTDTTQTNTTQTNTTQNVENYLALCGDIGNPFMDNYKKFLEIHSELYTRIFVITGNHEYYAGDKQRTISQIDERIRELTYYYPKVTFLNTNEPYQLGDTLFVGCALWTAVDEQAEAKMNDYRRIFVPESNSENVAGLLGRFKYESVSTDFGLRITRTWMVADRRLLRYMDVLEMHGEMLTYLEEVINGNYSNIVQYSMLDAPFELEKITQLIVLTHHAPSFQMLKEPPPSAPVLRDSDDSSEGWDDPPVPIDLSKCYATNLEQLFKPPVVCWISGHTHECKHVIINNIPSLSNCFGYPGQVTEFVLKKYITF